ncbi:hypothetical protein P12x_000070 [Tundrisphaera lichenicola]|uniref:hypothetical protein n=1 Tax=Tundrisphaera lichenicola TaxID=2029860 RepID=UPI003EBC9D8E
MIRAATRLVLLATSLGAAGCSGQYADEGSIDMAAAKEAAAKAGIDKFNSPSPSKKPTRRGASNRGPVVNDDKPAMPHRGALPQ